MNSVTSGNRARDEKILPIKKSSDRLRFKKLWLNSRSKLGLRNWVIFCMGIVTGLRACDLVQLQWDQVYRADRTPRRMVVGEKDQKTSKINHYLDIQPLSRLLIRYDQWLEEHYRSQWMFYKATSKNEHITPHYLYIIMRRAGDQLGLDHIGSHSLRKTMGYVAYQRTGDILYVMKKLNHSNPRMTLDYIDYSSESINRKTETLWRSNEF